MKIREHETSAALEWLWDYFPNFIRPVPRRRRESLAKGFLTKALQ